MKHKAWGEDVELISSELLVDCMEPKRERAGKENISNFWAAVNLFDDSMQKLDLGSVKEKESSRKSIRSIQEDLFAALQYLKRAHKKEVE